MGRLRLLPEEAESLRFLAELVSDLTSSITSDFLRILFLLLLLTDLRFLYDGAVESVLMSEPLSDATDSIDNIDCVEFLLDCVEFLLDFVMDFRFLCEFVDGELLRFIRPTLEGMVLL